MIQSSSHEYTDGHDRFVGHLVWDDALIGSAPGVLIAPAFGGLGPFEKQRAQDLAELGYVALAVDYYGDGKRTEDRAEASMLMELLNANRPVLARRMLAALETLKAQDKVNADRVGAIGYCLGGKAVLDLARTGEEFRACVPIHGLFDAPEGADASIRASVLALHGWDDPLATPDDVLYLTDELSAKCRDWQILAFGNTGHAFTNPSANSPETGMAFSQSASDRSWAALTRFLAERLKD